MSRSDIGPTSTAHHAHTAQEELDALDVERESLLDVVMAKAKKLGITEKIQRVLIALVYAKGADGGTDISNELSSTISQLEADDEKGGFVSGISLLMPGICLSLLEGPQRLVIGALRHFQKSGSRMKHLTASMHMFLSVQDAPGRCYPKHFANVIKVDPAAPSSIDLTQVCPIVLLYYYYICVLILLYI